MTHPHHHTRLDDACEWIVRPVTDDFLRGYRHGFRDWSAEIQTSRFYRRGYWSGRFSRENQWMATFGEGAAD